MQSSKVTLLGFVLLSIGVIALVLSLVGLRLSMLAFLDFSPIFSLVFKLLLIVVGLILMFLSKTSD